MCSTAVAMPTCASCTASASSRRTPPNWCRASTPPPQVHTHTHTHTHSLTDPQGYSHTHTVLCWKSADPSPPPPSLSLPLSSCLPSAEEKAGYLKALSHIMNNLPREVQMTELPAVSTHTHTLFTVPHRPKNSSLCVYALSSNPCSMVAFS